MVSTAMVRLPFFSKTFIDRSHIERIEWTRGYRQRGLSDCFDYVKFVPAHLKYSFLWWSWGPVVPARWWHNCWNDAEVRIHLVGKPKPFSITSPSNKVAKRMAEELKRWRDGVYDNAPARKEHATFEDYWNEVVIPDIRKDYETDQEGIVV